MDYNTVEFRKCRNEGWLSAMPKTKGVVGRRGKGGERERKESLVVWGKDAMMNTRNWQQGNLDFIKKYCNRDMHTLNTPLIVVPTTPWAETTPARPWGPFTAGLRSRGSLTADPEATVTADAILKPLKWIKV